MYALLYPFPLSKLQSLKQQFSKRIGLFPYTSIYLSWWFSSSYRIMSKLNKCSVRSLHAYRSRHLEQLSTPCFWFSLALYPTPCSHLLSLTTELNVSKKLQCFSTCGLWSFGDRGQTTIKKHTFTMRFITTAKLQLWSRNKNNFMVGVTTTWGTVLKGHGIRKFENHCNPFQGQPELEVPIFHSILLTFPSLLHFIFFELCAVKDSILIIFKPRNQYQVNM